MSAAASYTYTARPTPEAHDRQRSACVALARALHLDIARTLPAAPRRAADHGGPS